MTEQHDLMTWCERMECPHCEIEEPEAEFFNHTEGGGMDDFVRHNYLCSECGGEWYVESVFQAWKVIK